MQRLCLVLSLTTVICYWAESSPIGIGTLEFDNLDTDLDSLSYEVEEEDLEDYIKQLDAQEANKNANANKNSVKTTGFKKKNTLDKGSKNKHNIQDLKKFFKTAGIHDDGAYDDDDVYTNIEGVAAQAVGVKGNEDRVYRKGTKTRGFHRVHHKDEYKKDKIFYEDDETKGKLNKVGAKGLGFKIDAGAGFHKGHFHHDRHKGAYGKRGYSDKGFSDKEFNGYSDAQGFEKTFSSENKK